MALVADYDSDGESVQDSTTTIPRTSSRRTLHAAPEVSREDPMQLKMMLLNPSDKQMKLNLRYDDLSRSLQGPENPFRTESGVNQKKNVLTGYAEESAFSESAFRNQERTFQAFGYAQNPSLHRGSVEEYIGDTNAVVTHGGLSILEAKANKAEAAAFRNRRQDKGDSSVLDGVNAYKGPWAKYKVADESEPEDDALEAGEEYYEDAIQPLIFETRTTDSAANERTEFMGSEEYDYMGRSAIMHVPQDLDINLLGEPGQQECFIPKKHIHTWEGHHKGVMAICFFPRSGHMLLSCGNDNKIKIWDVYHQRELMRVYSGHYKSVKDITFQNDGRQFLSASFDRMVKLWDTETGQVKQRFDTGALPYVVKFNPDEDKQNEFLAGLSNKKIVQYDLRTGGIVQEYDHHLSAINTLTFVDENRRFISTSDDKSLRAWEWGINVPIKYIAEPEMHSLVSVALHPNGKVIAAQSLDNTIVVYAASDRFRQNRKKIFSGHRNAGFQPEVNFSPDGKFLMSGDSHGDAVFWDWKTTKLYRKFKAHEQCVVGIAPHPQETSKVATASWDGLIKYWD